jgi:pimeloyl-ACP methyl ester carboxylesterase
VLRAWVEAAGLERPGFVANSLGCQVVTELAVRRPALVGPLVLVGPTIDPARRGGRHQLFAALRDTAQEPLRLLGRVAVDDARAGARRLFDTARAALDDRIEERLPLVEQPAVVVRGGNDPFVGPEWGERVAGLLPNGSLVVVPGEPHAVHFTRPDLVAGVVRSLLLEEGEHASGDRLRLLQHRRVTARDQLEAGIRQEPLPLAGDA